VSLAAGTRVGPFEIVAPIGAGGMGEVFRARDARLGRDVAVKVLPSLFAADADRLRRFEQEARAAAALNHPNILVVYDVGTADGVPYVVSELLEGETLRQTLERGALTPRKAIDCGVQIASGLAAAHDKGIVHRDVKPENVFVTKDGRVKILDFGLAKPLEASSNDGSVATMAHTDPGMVVGTVGYMSPEQLRGEAVDARTDVFSLGAVLYEMFCGERAFKGKTAVDTMTAILKEDPAEFPQTLHATAPAIERIVRRCLEKNVHERFQSARDVNFAFDALSSASGVQSSASGIMAAPSTGPSRRLAPQLLGAAAAALIVVGAAAYFAGARLGAGEPAAPAITQLTFRNGTVRGARFSPDGATVLYAASWDGGPITLYSTRPGNPESSALNVPSADLLALSAKTSEMALALKPVIESTFFTAGTLARAPLSGGAPREVLEHVTSADFSPDGSQLAVVIVTPTGYRLEYPLGNSRLAVPYLLTNVRISPDGQRVAFISHPGGGDDGAVQVMDASGETRTLSDGWLSIGGLAWARGGRELWFTAVEGGGLRALRAVTLDGRQRLLYRAPERLQLEDVAPDGRVLMSGMTLQSQARFGSIAQKNERDLSWFDFATGQTLSADGKLMAFTESGEGAGTRYGVFIRPTNGDPAVRIADGQLSALSPDGRQLGIVTGPNAKSMLIAPTGPGQPHSIDVSKYTTFALWWFPDNRRIAIIASESAKRARTFVADTNSGSLLPLTPEGVRVRYPSPDMRWMAGSNDNGRILFDIQSKTVVPIKGSDPDDQVLGWTPDSRAVIVSLVKDGALRFYKIDIASGTRSLMSTVESADKAGFVQFGDATMAADGDHYAYGLTRQLSHLYLLTFPQ
jgi:WD40 repeat protein